MHDLGHLCVMRERAVANVRIFYAARQLEPSAEARFVGMGRGPASGCLHCGVLLRLRVCRSLCAHYRECYRECLMLREEGG